jgi:hypothetical protein
LAAVPGSGTETEHPLNPIVVCGCAVEDIADPGAAVSCRLIVPAKKWVRLLHATVAVR